MRVPAMLGDSSAAWHSHGTRIESGGAGGYSPPTFSHMQPAAGPALKLPRASPALSPAIHSPSPAFRSVTQSTLSPTSATMSSMSATQSPVSTPLSVTRAITPISSTLTGAASRAATPIIATRGTPSVPTTPTMAARATLAPSMPTTPTMATRTPLLSANEAVPTYRPLQNADRVSRQASRETSRDAPACREIRSDKTMLTETQRVLLYGAAQGRASRPVSYDVAPQPVPIYLPSAAKRASTPSDGKAASPCRQTSQASQAGKTPSSLRCGYGGSTDAVRRPSKEPCRTDAVQITDELLLGRKVPSPLKHPEQVTKEQDLGAPSSLGSPPPPAPTEVSTIDTLEEGLISGSKNTTTEGKVTDVSDEQFIRELLGQSNQILNLLTNYDMSDYIERWSELIDETCRDYAKTSPRGAAGARASSETRVPSEFRASSESNFSSLSESTIPLSGLKHNFHSPALGTMSKLAAAARRRLELAQSTQQALVDRDSQVPDAPDDEESPVDRHRRFKARVAKFIQEVNVRVRQIQKKVDQKCMAHRMDSPRELGTPSLNAFIRDLQGVDATKRKLFPEDSEECRVERTFSSSPSSHQLTETMETVKRSSSAGQSVRSRVRIQNIRRWKSVDRDTPTFNLCLGSGTPRLELAGA